MTQSIIPQKIIGFTQPTASCRPEHIQWSIWQPAEVVVKV